MAELVRLAGATPHPSAPDAGRNAFTQLIDAVLGWMRRYARPVHVMGAGLVGVLLFLYAWLVGRTARLISTGARPWPDFPQRCVLAFWHGSAPSLLSAIAKHKPASALVILISTEPRGDSLEVLCRLLGMRVIRGDWEHHGWPSLARAAEAVAQGACALITPDGGAPRGVARAGVLVLAAAAEVPVVAIGADCRPAIAEPRKWDQPRNPLPFGRIAVAIEEPMPVRDFADPRALESARFELQNALDQAQQQARKALETAPEEELHA